MRKEGKRNAQDDANGAETEMVMGDGERGQTDLFGWDDESGVEELELLVDDRHLGQHTLSPAVPHPNHLAVQCHGPRPFHTRLCALPTPCSESEPGQHTQTGQTLNHKPSARQRNSSNPNPKP
eukprot:525448-Rhodomonas_salina.2